MFKRRDWLHVKGADGKHGGDSSSDDESVASDRDRDEGEESEEEFQELEDIHQVGPPQERSEEGEESSEEPTAEEVIMAWSSDDPMAQGFKGIALRCIPCKVLLLNRDTYLQHLTSKGHKKKIKNISEPGEVIQLAIGSNEPQEEEETHGERLARIQSLAASAESLGKRLNGDSDSSDDEVDKTKPESVDKKKKRGQREKRKRPGKRQRVEMKDKGVDPASGKSFKKKPKRGGNALHETLNPKKD